MKDILIPASPAYHCCLLLVASSDCLVRLYFQIKQSLLTSLHQKEKIGFECAGLRSKCYLFLVKIYKRKGFDSTPRFIAL